MNVDSSLRSVEEESLDVDGNVKSMEAIWRRLHDVNLELPEELVVLMTLMGRPSILRDPKKNSGISKGPFHEDYQGSPATRSLKTQN